MSARSSTRTSSARVALLALAALLLVGGGDALAKRALVHDLPLPPRSRSLEPNLFESGRSFRKTVDFYERVLKRRGLPHEAVPVYGYRGTVVARFLSEDPGSQWLALHVFRSRGRTRIYIVPRPAKTP